MKGSVPTARFRAHRSFASLSAVTLFLALGATSVWGQSSTAGTVSGQVTDEQNAAVPGTQVKLIDTSTNAAQTTMTNDTGRYIFSQVSPGTYNVDFTKQGFSMFEVNAQKVQIGIVLTINAKLKVGATTTTVEVTATRARNCRR